MNSIFFQMLGINIDIKVIRWVPAENRNTIRIRQMTKKNRIKNRIHNKTHLKQYTDANYKTSKTTDDWTESL